ncbi:basic proline-rich protein-like [Sciurus carolinensis]|uniref:basic proline-rich protein-like n=1 Tax=Sciurus carolinensis TaxID=30640 RepID=UPI001FB4E3D6|nr:basic proline-rich protein-like [Sciurus carolinensis]
MRDWSRASAHTPRVAARARSSRRVSAPPHPAGSGRGTPAAPSRAAHTCTHKLRRPRHVPGAAARGASAKPHTPPAARSPPPGSAPIQAAPPPSGQLPPEPRMLRRPGGATGGPGEPAPGLLTACHCQDASPRARPGGVRLNGCSGKGKARSYLARGRGDGSSAEPKGLLPGAGDRLETAPLLPPLLSPRPPRPHEPEARRAQEGLPPERLTSRDCRCRCLRRRCNRH